MKRTHDSATPGLPAGALDEHLRLPVLLVFWRASRGPLAGTWLCRNFPVAFPREAQEFARDHGALVIASFVSVPNVACEHWRREHGVSEPAEPRR